MDKILVTGATGFLGHHVVRRLNEQAIRPHVLELAGSDPHRLDTLDVELCEGHLEDPQALAAACTGMDTLLHLAFKVSVGGGAETHEEMRRINLLGSQRLFSSAEAMGVTTAVVASSCLAVGVNRRAEPLDENADWGTHAVDIPYARIRRQAEQQALSMAKPGFSVVAVCPSFTLGPDDPVGAPANKLLKSLVTGKLPLKLPVGFGCLDVRDFASGVLLAAERGRPGQRYLLSGENVTMVDFADQAASVADVSPPRFTAPKALLEAAVIAVGLLSKLRSKEPPITRDVLQIIGRYAWYETTRARSELGWVPRPLRQTLEDTTRWLRDQEVSVP